MDVLEILKLAGSGGSAVALVFYMWINYKKSAEDHKILLETAKIYTDSQNKIAEKLDRISIRENEISEHLAYLKAVVEQNTITIREKLTVKNDLCEDGRR